MVTNESARGDAGQLVDEQQLAGDPRGGKGGQPKTTWTIGFQAKELYYPLAAFIDLGAVHRLRDVLVYDSNSSGELKIEAGTPAKWQPLISDPLSNYGRWNRHPVDVETRYLHVVVSDPGTLAPEIVLYGQALGPLQVPVIPAAKARPFAKMDELIGTNAFIDDPLDKMQAVGFVREYHSWGWDAGDGKSGAAAYPNNLVAFNPSSGAGGNAWFFDDYYAKLKKAGITVSPSIKGSVNWLFPAAAKPTELVADAGADPTLPQSYKAHSDHLFQFAARYGNRKVPDAQLKLAPNQPRLSGLGLLRYFENANEPDAWWQGRAGYSTPYELAARSSADYDGHQKTMGATFGVKNADPNAQLVMGGLAGLRLEYLQAMKAWADWHRGGDFPADVLNFHHYSNDIGGQGQSQQGISPEADKLKERLQTLSDYRNRYLPTKELWLTEFGYDTHPASVQRAPAIGETSGEEVQARWMLRSYLACAAAGIERAAQYMLRDVDPQNPQQYSTSGLVTQKGEWKPKTAWFYTYTLKNRLAGMRFQSEMASGNPKVWIYRFKGDQSGGAYVVWCPTSENAVVSNFKLPIPGAKTANLVEFVGGETRGKASPLALKGGAVTLGVSELPLIILVDSLRP